MDQYQYSIDKDSRIINNPNKFKPEGGKYIFDSILNNSFIRNTKAD